MALEEYRRKRDFSKTSEPLGRDAGIRKGSLFVVQKHAASRLHYDFRLEMGGVLKSWAVPKGPSLDPSEKHLAVHVEDHPLEYGGFEGIIPQGEYGGGAVMIWDRGWWEPEGDPWSGYEKGNLKFRLHGERLGGSWALVRLHGKPGEEEKNWLLLKKRDAFATAGRDPRRENQRSVVTGRTMKEIRENADAVWTREGLVKGRLEQVPENLEAGSVHPEEIPGAKRGPVVRDVKPELAMLGEAPPEGDEWVHEIKHDGYRIIAYVEGEGVRLVSRNRKDWTERFPAIARALPALPVEAAVLDGEVVVQQPDGTSDFQSLQNLLQGTGRGMLLYYVFDLLYLDGFDLRGAPLIARKDLLEKVLAGSPGEDLPVRFSGHIRGRGEQVFRHACRFALEGIVSKHADSLYEQKRCRMWQKTKCVQRQEFVIGGYTDPAGGRTGFGALLLGVYDEEVLVFVGRVGTGFSERSLLDLLQRMKPLQRSDSPFVNPPSGRQARSAHWVDPRLVAEVEFTAWTKDGSLRHPSFQGLREDKDPREITRETRFLENSGQPSKQPGRQEEKDMVAGIKLSSPDRILYPAEGVTKAELAEYYEEVSDRILPHIVHRPLTLVRCPEGHEEECFFQKHITESMPDSIRAIPVKEKEGTSHYIGVKDLKGIISLVQLGTLEFHPWGSREDRLERPDTMIFDLDPAPDVPWDRTVHGARFLHDLLLELGLQNFVKTSGGKGLHVVVPLTRRSGWDEVKGFAGAVSEAMVRMKPKTFIATMSKSKRTGKIFLDYFRNNRGSTSVAPYSTRAKKGAPVSAPLSWNEFSPGIKADQYTVTNLRRRLAGLKQEPWEGYFQVRQSITKKMKQEVGME
ncbi:MAG: DNA ligase D [Desulfovibrionales bacterium]